MAQLAALPVVARTTGDGAYQRLAYMPKGWVDTDGNGCTQREDVLLASVDTTAPYTVAKIKTCPRTVTAGTWTDPYTGKSITLTDTRDPSQGRTLQVDHVVPLAEIDRSGGAAWSAEVKQARAGDLINLVAVAASVNASKGDSDPAAWKPRKEAQCAYATQWIRVKTAWGLAVDQPEKNALTAMLGTCPR